MYPQFYPLKSSVPLNDVGNHIVKSSAIMSIATRNVDGAHVPSQNNRRTGRQGGTAIAVVDDLRGNWSWTVSCGAGFSWVIDGSTH